jgi:hypothetical protein
VRSMEQGAWSKNLIRRLFFTPCSSLPAPRLLHLDLFPGRPYNQGERVGDLNTLIAPGSAGGCMERKGLSCYKPPAEPGADDTIDLRTASSNVVSYD